MSIGPLMRTNQMTMMNAREGSDFNIEDMHC